jgi:hypothetical protein
MDMEMITLILSKDLNMKICPKIILENLGSKQKSRIKIASDLSARFCGNQTFGWNI